MRTVPAALLATSLAGCFYTGPINERPRAEIEKLTPGPYHYPGDRIELVARKSSDSESGALEATWSAYTCPTPTSCSPLGETMVLALDQSYWVDIPSHDPIQIQLKVRDSRGAETRDVETIEVGNRPPVIALQVTQGGQAPGLSESYVVTVPLEVAVVATDPDGDAATLEWQLVRPRESDPNEVEWGPLGDGVYELTPDVPGIWRVDVTASDGLPEGSETRMEQILVAEDQPPCIGITSPTAAGEGRYVLRREDGPRRFAVLHASDDLDPHPRPAIDSPYLGSTTFAWWLGGPQTGGDLVLLTGATGADYILDPAGYAPGDVVELRVEASDRVEREPTCPPSEPSCGITDSCLQRVTWEVEIR